MAEKPKMYFNKGNITVKFTHGGLKKKWPKKSVFRFRVKEILSEYSWVILTNKCQPFLWLST